MHVVVVKVDSEYSQYIKRENVQIEMEEVSPRLFLDTTPANSVKQHGVTAIDSVNKEYITHRSL